MARQHKISLINLKLMGSNSAGQTVAVDEHDSFTFSDAQKTLNRWAKNAPRLAQQDFEVVRFILQYEDGHKYDGKLALTRDGADNNLIRHIHQSVTMATNLGLGQFFDFIIDYQLGDGPRSERGTRQSSRRNPSEFEIDQRKPGGCWLTL